MEGFGFLKDFLVILLAALAVTVVHMDGMLSTRGYSQVAAWAADDALSAIVEKIVAPLLAPKD